MEKFSTSEVISQRPPGDSHILVAPGVGFLLLCLARGSSRRRGVLNQRRSSIILKKKTIFALSLKQIGSSSFHTFIYARREQCDLGPIYTTQRIRIYPGKLKFILVKISPYRRRYMPKKTKLYSRFLLLRILYPDSPVHTSGNIRRVFRFVQLCCKFARVNAFTL